MGDASAHRRTPNEREAYASHRAVLDEAEKDKNDILQKLYYNTTELYKCRLQDVRSGEERAHLKEDHKLDMGRIRTAGAEEYHSSSSSKLRTPAAEMGPQPTH